MAGFMGGPGPDMLDRNYVALSGGVAGLTAGRVPYVGTDGGLKDVAGFTFDGTGLTVASLACGEATFTDIDAATVATTATVDVGTGITIGGALDHNGTTVGLYGVTPVARAAAYTQTHSAVSRTHANPTATALTNAFGTANGTFEDATGTHSQSILNNNFKECSTQINALIVDVQNLKEVLNSVIDDSQAIGISQ